MNPEPEYKPFLRAMSSDLLAPAAKLQLAEEWLARNTVKKRDPLISSGAIAGQF